MRAVVSEQFRLFQGRLIIQELSNRLGVAAVARINSAIEAPFSFENRGYALSASIGSAQFPDDSGDINALLEIADQRMYQAKRRYRPQPNPTAVTA